MDVKAFSDWLTQKLMNVRNELEMETGIASFIEQDNYTIVAVDSKMEGVFTPGMMFPLADTYCRAVCKEQGMVTYPHVGMIKAMLQHPVYQAVKLESYIAVPIFNDDKQVLGTLNFTSLNPHKSEFSDSEKTLVENFGQELQQKLALYKQVYASLANQ